MNGRVYSACVIVCASHLVGCQSENAVQVLNQLFECGPVGGDGMPAVLHHHVPENRQCDIIYLLLRFVFGAAIRVIRRAQANIAGSMKGQLLHRLILAVNQGESLLGH